MPIPLKVLYLAAEAEPFVKVGGLGDVAGSLPRFLRALRADSTVGAEVDARLAIPFHSILRAAQRDLRPLLAFPLARRSGVVDVRVLETKLDGMPVYMVDAEPISRGGSVYSSDSHRDAEKYACFSLAALEFVHRLDWAVDVVHTNDWHTALAAYSLMLRKKAGHLVQAKSVLTVHNLAFAGPDMAFTLSDYGLATVDTGLPPWAQSVPLPMGISAADAIVAVSPSYAEEIQTPSFGSGLDGYLRARRGAVHGILNGIDTESFNPALDPALAANFGLPTLDKRAGNKKDLQGRLGLPIAEDTPLIGVVSRLEHQKGIELLAPVLRMLDSRDWQAVVLGTGMQDLERSVLELQNEYADRVRVQVRYDAELARRIYAGADLLLMPSRYEPCGLAQMIAMRYGCLPVVTAVGGLKDTVVDGESGFVVAGPSVESVAAGLTTALTRFSDRATWTQMQRRAMSRDFSWRSSASKYVELYDQLRVPLTENADH